MSERGDRVKAEYYRAAAQHEAALVRFHAATRHLRPTPDFTEEESIALAAEIERVGIATGHDRAYRELQAAEETLLSWGAEQMRAMAGVDGGSLEARHNPAIRRKLIAYILTIRG